MMWYYSDTRTRDVFYRTDGYELFQYMCTADGWGWRDCITPIDDLPDLIISGALVLDKTR